MSVRKGPDSQQGQIMRSNVHNRNGVQEYARHRWPFFRITDIWQSVGAVITVAYYCKTWQLDINHMYPMYEREKEKHGKGEFLMYNVV